MAELMVRKKVTTSLVEALSRTRYVICRKFATVTPVVWPLDKLVFSVARGCIIT